ncbi:TonB-dependent receptor domain-containing protein [Sphingobium quisquiliarum]|uniref:TonB-dependent receptor domain-containing protein n=1 Tax=Sphingobium quisquiliarum TaxID=538379 RepID=UPI001F1FFD57|nr:TonB-dependent receptor [Sphingobium quisquiliarum]
MNWVIGGYYFNATGQVDPNLVTLSGPAVNPFFPVTSSTLYSRVKTESFAAFTQATVPLTDALNFTAGLRYTTEKRSLNAEQILGGVPVPPSNYEQEKRYSKPTWRVALDYKITPDVMIYTSYNRGFKSGGFNPTTPGEDPFKPEQLDAYEGGIKSELFDRKLRFNLAAFYYNYKNIQVPYFLINTIGLKTGPKATIYGVDFDFEAHPFQQLRLFGGLSLLHDKFGHYPDAALSPPNPPPLGGNQSVVGDATGNRLPFTSTFSGNIGAAYEIPVGDSKITLNGNLYHNSGFYAETDNLRRQPAYELVSGSIQWTDATGKLTVSVWGKNLTNEAVVTMLAASGFGTGASYQPPRTYGATLGYAF